jgi:hypothetical protein
MSHFDWSWPAHTYLPSGTISPLERVAESCFDDLLRTSKIEYASGQLKLVETKPLSGCLNGEKIVLQSANAGKYESNYKTSLSLRCGEESNFTSISGWEMQAPKIRSTLCQNVAAGEFRFAIELTVKEMKADGTLAREYNRKRTLSDATGEKGCAWTYTEGKRTYNDCVWQDRIDANLGQGLKNVVFLQAKAPAAEGTVAKLLPVGTVELEGVLFRTGHSTITLGNRVGEVLFNPQIAGGTTGSVVPMSGKMGTVTFPTLNAASGSSSSVAFDFPFLP